jgi:ribosome biogenesis protein Tsr3
MMNDSFRDPIMDALSGLPPLTVRQSHDREVRQRCHRLLAQRRIHRHGRPIRLMDVIAGTAAALYLVAVVSEAMRLLAATGG